MKRIVLLLVVLSMTILLLGCRTVPYTVGGFGVGLAKDIKDTWNSIEKADNWFRDKYW